MDLATLYYRFFSSEVGLAVPMLVDLSSGLSDKAQTTLAQQVELFDMLSQASMRGLVPGAPGLRVHPFVGSTRCGPSTTSLPGPPSRW